MNNIKNIKEKLKKSEQFLKNKFSVKKSVFLVRIQEASKQKKATLIF
ncbi:MAG: hypothetical protein AAB361_03650 [Patescibacteria group bacterium]